MKQSVVRLVVRLVIGFSSCVAIGCTTADHGSGSGGQSGGAGAGVGGAADGGSSPGTGGKGTGGSTGSAGSNGSNGSTGGAGVGAGTGGATGAGGSGSTAYTCPAGPFTAPVVPTGVSPTRVAGLPPLDAFNNNGNDFGIIEGPVWLGDAVYVSEIANGNGNIPPARILKVTAAGVVSIAVADSGSNGLAIDSTGGLLSANHKVGGIVRFALPAGAPTTVVGTYNSARFDSPNDLAVARDGTIYFSDPDHQAGNQHPQTATRVYRVAAGTSVATPITDYMNQPNGITLSLDEKTLFVSGGNGVVKYPINTNGTVGTGVPIFNPGGGVDGMAMDCAGHLFVAVINTLYVAAIDSAATAITPELGRVTITDNIQAVTNVAFGGADHQTIYISALGNSKGLFQMHMGTPGMPY